MLSHTSFVFPVHKYLNRDLAGFSEGVKGIYELELDIYIFIVQNQYYFSSGRYLEIVISVYHLLKLSKSNLPRFFEICYLYLLLSLKSFSLQSANSSVQIMLL